MNHCKVGGALALNHCKVGGANALIVVHLYFLKSKMTKVGGAIAPPAPPVPAPLISFLYLGFALRRGT